MAKKKKNFMKMAKAAKSAKPAKAAKMQKLYSRVTHKPVGSGMTNN